MPTVPPCRPLKHPPSRSYRWEGDRLIVTLTGGKLAVRYHVAPVSTDLGGVALRWEKLDGKGTAYHVLVAEVDSSCDCPGWTWAECCKHLEASAALVAVGAVGAT